MDGAYLISLGLLCPAGTHGGGGVALGSGMGSVGIKSRTGDVGSLRAWAVEVGKAAATLRLTPVGGASHGASG